MYFPGLFIMQAMCLRVSLNQVGFVYALLRNRVSMFVYQFLVLLVFLKIIGTVT